MESPLERESASLTRSPGGFVTTNQVISNSHEPMDCSPPGSSVHGISQVRMLERVTISFSRGSSWLRDQMHISCISAWADGFLVLHIKLMFLAMYSFLNMAGSFWQSFRNRLIVVIETHWSRNWLNVSLKNPHDIFLWNKMYLGLGISFLVTSSLISQLW